MDSDQETAIFVNDLQDANRKLINKNANPDPAIFVINLPDANKKLI